MEALSQIHSYSYPTNIRFGPGAVKETPGYLKSQNLTSPLIVTDSQVSQLDFFKKFNEDLNRSGLKPRVYSEIHSNPVKSDVILGGNRFSEGSCDSIVGIGGGAGMDVARAIALRVHHKEDLFVYDELVGGNREDQRPDSTFHYHTNHFRYRQ